MEYFSSGSDNFNCQKEQDVFQSTFDILNKTLGEEAFSPANPSRKGLSSRFAIYHYEAISLCIASHLDKLKNLSEDGFSRLTNVLIDVKKDEEFINMTTGGGKNYADPLKRRIAFVEERIRGFCDGL